MDFWWLAEHPIHALWILPLADLILAAISMLIIVKLPFGNKEWRGGGKHAAERKKKRSERKKSEGE